MDIKTNIMEPLLERVEIYGKTSFELIRLKALSKTASIASILVSRVIIMSVLFLSISSLSVGASLWLGEMIGKWYYGFFCIAGFYAIIGGVLYLLMRSWMRERISNSIIKQLLN